MRGYHVIVFSLLAVSVIAEDSFDTSGVRIALKIYDDCAKADGFSPCLKKKAITFLDRLSRMEKLTVADGVVLARASDAAKDGVPITEEQLENSLPRSSDAKDDALNGLLMDKVSNFFGSRTVEIAIPKITAEDFVGTGRKGGGGGGLGGGGGGGGGGKMKNMMGGMMMAVAAKMAALVPIAIAGLFLLAGKALITAKIALLISGIIAIKKLFASKNQGSGHGGGWQSSGHGGGGGGGGGGWQSSGGGWDKRSLEDVAAQKLAYKAYAPAK